MTEIVMENDGNTITAFKTYLLRLEALLEEAPQQQEQ
jgi:hypothetical protein